MSPQQQRIAAGARLIVADGCAACHLGARPLGPSFESFAGHVVRLAQGGRVLVDERFLREALTNPVRDALAGYDSAPMRAAVARLRLAREPRQVAQLAAFIEEVGPEPG